MYEQMKNRRLSIPKPILYVFLSKGSRQIKASIKMKGMLVEYRFYNFSLRVLLSSC